LSTEERLGELLMAGSLTLAVAESCTGGLLSQMITSVPGASHYFLGGVVAYSNGSKVEMVGVPQDTLRNHGAVSERTAIALALGVRQAFDSDLGIGVTGIAGPGGADEKPVGTVHIAIVNDITERVQSFLLSGDRAGIRAEAAATALRLACEFLESDGQ
jgi:PncC family amidohydrolase